MFSRPDIPGSGLLDSNLESQPVQDLRRERIGREGFVKCLHK